MPIVAINITESEASRIDDLAAREKRVRKQQTHVLTLIGLEKVEAEIAAETNKTTEEPAK